MIILLIVSFADSSIQLPSKKLILRIKNKVIKNNSWKNRNQNNGTYWTLRQKISIGYLTTLGGI